MNTILILYHMKQVRNDNLKNSEKNILSASEYVGLYIDNSIV